jgi:hypothetical protein
MILIYICQEYTRLKTVTSFTWQKKSLAVGSVQQDVNNTVHSTNDRRHIAVQPLPLIWVKGTWRSGRGDDNSNLIRRPVTAGLILD